MAKAFTSFSQNVRYLTRSLEPRLLAADLGGQPRSKVTTCLFSTGRVDRTNTGYPRPRLSPQEVSAILRQNEGMVQLNSGGTGWTEQGYTSSGSYSIDSVDSNQLASNSPIEDKLASAKCLHTTGYLFGVFDGHGGPECSQVVAKRLFDYVAAALLPRKELRRVVSEWEAGNRIPVIQVYNDPSQFVTELQEIYQDSFLRYCISLLSAFDEDFSMEEVLIQAFVQLDNDMGREVVENQQSAVLEPLLRVALSGSVACVAHIDGPHLHIANTGDCGAVLGMQSQTAGSGWRALRLTRDHNWENPDEIERVLSEHPDSESEHVIADQRLLGVLMPFRAFGDFRFKWDLVTQAEIIQRYLGPEHLIRHCITPPYLTVTPEVTYHRLRPRDRFLLMGSDGLWECMSPLDTVTLVGEYMSGRQTLQPVRFPRQAITLREVASILEQRQKGLNLKPVDTNASTHLIRHALGGSDAGLDHARLSHSLTLPPEVRRFFRDDISIHVIFFDPNFLRVCPVEI
ncbi:pyruvate dehydrogenase [acetyl-transferring]-phosphatase 1, mitochondrial-like isoform X1 [Penaeus chinensis]|uniref:pyruvate dehydrogenase [acetyl-transferring]-phosphatase 1, mitochondrial-like isoform X1 n=2 Tax=Penaeus chinensis TaxID=139456 RepID=UPI001FB59E67|nr:pyruvate dehydrogenase [acetyl-transferring]-phosphatase 1, mitochondrial-like isoform X1 [Penaeus chinensis]